MPVIVNTTIFNLSTTLKDYGTDGDSNYSS